MTQLWCSQFSHKRTLSEFPTILVEDRVILTTVVGGVIGLCLKTGNQVWPTLEQKHKATTSPVLWTCSKDKKVIVYGTSDSFEVLNYLDGSMVYSIMIMIVFKMCINSS